MAAKKVPHLKCYVTTIQQKILFIFTPSSAGKMMDFSYLKAFLYSNKTAKYKTAFALLLKMSFINQKALFGCSTHLRRCWMSVLY